MYDYNKPPQIPYVFKLVGIILFASASIAFLLFYNLYKEEIFYFLEADKVYNIFRISFILSLLFVLFSKEKVSDERLLQFKAALVMHGLLFIMMGYIMGLLVETLFNISLVYYLDPTSLLIVGNIGIIYRFYTLQKDF